MRAYRTWAIGSKGIKSGLDPERWKNPTWWNPGLNTAACKFHDHYAPEPDCRCGFRGNPDYDSLIWWVEKFKGVDVSAIGVVELGGTILTGDHAHQEIPGILRAETATIVGPLVVPANVPAMVCRYLERVYSVKVFQTKSWIPGRWLGTVDRTLFNE